MVIFRNHLFRPWMGLLGTILVMLSCGTQPHIRTNGSPSEAASLRPTAAFETPAPSCKLPCDSVRQQQAMNYAELLFREEKSQEALAFLQRCNAVCLNLICAFEKSYAHQVTSSTLKTHARNVMALTDLCLAAPPDGILMRDFLGVRDDQENATKIAARYGFSPFRKKFGIYLSGIGAAMVITSIVLLSFHTGNQGYIPLGGTSCYNHSRGDGITTRDLPCIVDAKPFSIPFLILGAGMLGTGIGFAVHYQW